MSEAADRPAVSVVLPTHNRAGVLPRAVRSVLEQTFRDLEIIVVDDASTDDTEPTVRGLTDARIRYLRLDRNVGAAAARNRGVGAARGDLIAFQDSDDEWLPDKLEKQLAAMSAGEGVDVVYCGFVRSGDADRRVIPDPRQEQRDGDLLPALLFENFVSTQTLLIARTRLDAVGGFDERLSRFQDWELAIRLAAATAVRLVDEPLVVIHDTPGSISSNAAAGAAALRIMLDKHGALYRRHRHALAHVCQGLAHLEVLAGAAPEARRHFRQTLRIKPYSIKVWAALVLSHLGGRAYRLAHAAKCRVMAMLHGAPAP